MLIDMLSETYKPFMIVMTKADKLKDSEISAKLNTIANEIKMRGSLASPFVHAVSAK